MARKLATIQKIAALHPIPDADAIEVAQVLGWKVVVKKGEFQVGDFVIYCEIDSVMPKDNPAFDFLESSNWRIRTRKLRGQVSQGICFPLDIIPEDLYCVGDDVSDLLGITKFEPPIPACLQGSMKGQFPSFIPKTDEDRVQILGSLIERWAGSDFVATEKLDGTSCTFYLKDGEFGVAGRNIEYLPESNNTYWQMAQKYKVEEALRWHGHNIAIQGEIIGDGIQGNKYGLPKNERRFYAFSAYEIDSMKYLSRGFLRNFTDKYGIPHVPEVWLGTLVNDIDALVELSKGKSALNEQTRREGIVLRPANPHSDVQYAKVSMKAINPDFLLKYGE